MEDRVIVLGQRVGDIMMIRIPNSEHALEIHPDKKIVFKTPPNNPKPTKFVLRRCRTARSRRSRGTTS